MKNKIGFTALVGCALGMGALVGCGTEDLGTAGEPVESTSEALIAGQACAPDPTGVLASSVRVNTNNVATNAIDRNIATRWESEWTDAQWIRVDLGSAMPLTGVTLTWQNSCGKDYDIQTADVATGPWTTVVPVRGNTKSGTTNPLTHNFTKTARFVRMNGIKRCTGFGYSLFELQVNTKTLNCNLDRDGDGFGSPYLFCGSCVSGNLSSSNDCNDGNVTAKPTQTAYFMTPMSFTDGTPASFDWNCDGALQQQSTSGAIYVCTNSAGVKVSDCSQCVYNFVAIDGSDCGQSRCSLQGVEQIACH
jgi:hypothetical protein